MIAQQASSRYKALFAGTGLTMVVVSLLLMAALVRSPHVLSKPLPQASGAQDTETSSTDNAAAVQQSTQQPRMVDGQAVYAVPILSGPAATAILQNVQGMDIAYVVHSFPGWGKSVSTAISWFRCADIVDANEYLGSQIEVEAWFFLTEQERREVQAACMI